MRACTAGALLTGLVCVCSAARADEGPSPAVIRVANTTLAAQPGEAGMPHLGTGSTLGELLRHPAFAGHARRLLPRDDVAIDETLPIERMGSLLPFHSHVVPDVVIAALNHLIDEVGRGTPVFHELYTPAQQQGDPTKASTGLFFFRGRPGAPFALIAPGGGFSYVGSVHEGFPYALEISRQGYNAFVLRYRVGQGRAPPGQPRQRARGGFRPDRHGGHAALDAARPLPGPNWRPSHRRGRGRRSLRRRTARAVPPLPADSAVAASTRVETKAV